MHADDVTAIVEAIQTTVRDIDQIIPSGSSLTAQVESVGPKLLAELQRAVRARYGELPSPIGEEWRQLLTDGILAELLLLGYRNLEDDEKVWADEWRRRWETGVAALAAGVDSVAEPTPRRGALAVASSTRQFTLDGFDQVLG